MEWTFSPQLRVAASIQQEVIVSGPLFASHHLSKHQSVDSISKMVQIEHIASAAESNGVE